MDAGQSQVLRDCSAAVLFGNDVIKLEGSRLERLRHAAVFTHRTGAVPNGLAKRFIHDQGATEEAFSDLRALECSTARRLFT